MKPAILEEVVGWTVQDCIDDVVRGVMDHLKLKEITRLQCSRLLNEVFDLYMDTKPEQRLQPPEGLLSTGPINEEMRVITHKTVDETIKRLLEESREVERIEDSPPDIIIPCNLLDYALNLLGVPAPGDDFSRDWWYNSWINHEGTPEEWMALVREKLRTEESQVEKEAAGLEIRTDSGLTVRRELELWLSPLNLGSLRSVKKALASSGVVRDDVSVDDFLGALTQLLARDRVGG